MIHIRASMFSDIKYTTMYMCNIEPRMINKRQLIISKFSLFKETKHRRIKPIFSFDL